MTPTLPEAVANLPPTATLVYRELQHAETDCLPIAVLQHRTGRGASTLRRSIRALESAGHVERKPQSGDARGRRVCLCDE